MGAMEAIVRCEFGEQKYFLRMLEPEEGRAAFMGFNLSIDARNERMRHAAAAYGKRNRKMDRRDGDLG